MDERSRGGFVLLDHAVEQVFKILVVGLQATQEDAVMVGEHAERARDPATRHGDTDLAATVVAEKLHAFLTQLLKKRWCFALDLQAIAIMAALAQLGNVALAEDAAMIQDDHAIADALDVAQQMRG